MADRRDFDASVALPPGLEIAAVRKAIDHIEKELGELVELYYEKHRHTDTAQQRFPDLRRRGSGTIPRPEESLESKGSKRPWAIQSHFDHPGWYIVWRYLVDPTESLEPGRPVVIWRVDVVYLQKSDWKYEGSTAGSAGGGRTHAFGIKQASKKLSGKAVYQRRDVVGRDGKPIQRNGDGEGR